MNALASIMNDAGQIIPDAIYSRAKAARILNRTTRTLYRWEQEGVGPRVTRQGPGAAPEYRGRDLIDHLNTSAN